MGDRKVPAFVDEKRQKNKKRYMTVSYKRPQETTPARKDKRLKSQNCFLRYSAHRVFPTSPNKEMGHVLLLSNCVQIPAMRLFIPYRTVYLPKYRTVQHLPC